MEVVERYPDFKRYELQEEPSLQLPGFEIHYDRRKIYRNMQEISAHILRHTGCTGMAGRGMDVKVLQYIMGHANIAVTMEIYNHITEYARIEKEILKMEDLMVV